MNNSKIKQVEANIASVVKPPKRWKSLLMTFSVVFPTFKSLRLFVAPYLTSLPMLAQEVLFVCMMCLVLSYALPLAGRYFANWLRK